MKKAQLLAQPFIIIFALLVAVLILAWGIKVVFDIKDKGEYADLLTTISDLREEVQTYYNFETGSRKPLNLRVPSNIDCFCFKDISSPPLHPVPAYCNDDLLDNQLRTPGLNYNLFITPTNAFSLTKFKMIEPTTHLRPVENPLCIQIKNNKFQAIIENAGNEVKISKYCAAELGTCAPSCLGGFPALDCPNLGSTPQVCCI